MKANTSFLGNFKLRYEIDAIEGSLTNEEGLICSCFMPSQLYNGMIDLSTGATEKGKSVFQAF